MSRNPLALVLSLVLSGAALAAPAASAPAPQHTVGTDGKRSPVLLGIKDVCAWPNLVLLKDGTIAALIFNQPSHGRLIGGIDCWASIDGGTTWAKRATAAPPDPGVEHTRMNHAAGLAANGDLIVVAGGWTLYPKPNEHGPFEVDKLMRPYVSRSTDGGRTWAINKEAFPETAPGGKVYVPFGSIAKAKDDTLRVSAYVVGGKTFVLRSDDDGRTWKDPIQVETEMKPSETTLWSDGHGRMLAAARTRTLEIFESTDDGTSWRHLSRASDDLGIPGDLRLLADGRLLVTHGNRRKGGEGVDVRLSEDGGRTWSAPRRVADFIGYDGGYPSSVQLPDGKVVTAFYARKTADRDGYQMGVGIWDPTASFGQSKSTDPGASPAEKITTHQLKLDGADRTASYLLYEPARPTPNEQRWLVVYLYGAGGSTKSYNLKRPPYEQIRRQLASKGAYILVPELGPSHFMNETARKTLGQMIDHVLAEQQINGGRVHLMGTSMGGLSALAYALHHPARVRSVCAIMPVTDVAAWFRERPKYAKRLTEAYGGTPDQRPQVYEENSATRHPDRFAQIPVFLIHGTADTTVPIRQSQALAEALTAKGYPCTLRPVADGAHADAIVTDAQSEIVNFIAAAQP